MRWEDIEEIVKTLEENYPEEEIEILSLLDLEDMVRSLNDFEDVDVESNKQTLKQIQEGWLELRESDI